MVNAGRAFLVKVNANIGNSAVSSSIEEVRIRQEGKPCILSSLLDKAMTAAL